jgi:nucleotide-binding universal stress UspA family protein
MLKPAESIVDYAEKNRLELVALTTHEEGGLGRLVFGSTAVYVLRESSRPVLIIKPQRNSQI